MRHFLISALLLLASSAQAWTEPPRGSELRANLMDAIRPHIEWALGAPVEFVVWELRVEEDVAFASLWAQRPGGGDIDMYASPGAARGDIDPDLGDGPTVQVLYQRSGDVWVAVHHGIGATDMWWSWTGYCPIWHPVILEVCAG